MTITIDGDEVTGVTIDGAEVDSITIDGETVWESVVIVDDFEHNDLNTYYEDPSDWETASGAAYEGSFGLRKSTSSSTSDLVTLPADHVDYDSGAQPDTLDAYPERGEGLMEFFVRFDSGGMNDVDYIGRILWCMQGDSRSADGYKLEFNHSSGDDMLVLLRDNADNSNIDFDTVTLTEDIWYRFELEMDASGISLDMYEDADDTLVTALSGGDTTYDSGGIVYWQNAFCDFDVDEWRYV